MKGIMDLLVAAKLVTLSEEEQAQAAAEEAAGAAVTTPAAAEEPPPPLMPSEPPPVHYVTEAVAPGLSFEELYREAHIPSSPFPAERLLRLLDGLRAMDEATRKAAVRAMDEADENWNIDDPVLDAQRKIQALDAFCQALEAKMARRKEQAAADMANLKAAHEQTSREIRKQISELEKLLDRETQKTAEKMAALEAECNTLQNQVDSEKTRMQQEIARLSEISAQFGQAPNHS